MDPRDCGKQRRMVAAGDLLLARLIVVVGHQVHCVDILGHLSHLGMLKKIRSCADSGGNVKMWLMRLSGHFVETGAQFLEQQGVVSFVLGPEGVSRAWLAGKFPVDVQAIEIVVGNKRLNAIDENRPACRRQRCVRESARPQPASDRNQDGEARVVFLQRVECGEVGCVRRDVPSTMRPKAQYWRKR